MSESRCTEQQLCNTQIDDSKQYNAFNCVEQKYQKYELQVIPVDHSYGF